MIETDNHEPSELVVITADGPQRIASLAELLDSLHRLGVKGHLEEERFPAARLRVLV